MLPGYKSGQAPRVNDLVETSDGDQGTVDSLNIDHAYVRVRFVSVAPDHVAPIALDELTLVQRDH